MLEFVFELRNSETEPWEGTPSQPYGRSFVRLLQTRRKRRYAFVSQRRVRGSSESVIKNVGMRKRNRVVPFVSPTMSARRFRDSMVPPRIALSVSILSCSQANASSLMPGKTFPLDPSTPNGSGISNWRFPNVSLHSRSSATFRGLPKHVSNLWPGNIAVRSGESSPVANKFAGV